MTFIISSSINGLLSPFQVIFISTTQIKSLLPNNQGKKITSKVDGISFLLKIISQPLKPQKDLFTKIIAINSHIEQLDLPQCQIMIWLLNCWFIHKNTQKHIG
jgi:hypothetical protein